MQQHLIQPVCIKKPQVDVVQALIRDRVAIASSAETGRDLEHCVLLSRKFDEFRTVRLNSLCIMERVSHQCVCVHVCVSMCVCVCGGV